ncbi:hypothetical protein PAXINDRAFT_87912 [Paxillus involutus ATCC 200175]|uniref:WD40 repeat-like protein n=1 Tax=Paxillus involutus ATCC 200175 TaxID=664439 RepID=A0A0C9SPN9_PAXIN|nr:hypothetical protein PAXINDRAFT_87912 [Paxillus involutus ATCC 200175]
MLRLYDTARNAYRRARGLPVLQSVLRGHTGAIVSVAFLPDGKQVISGSHDGSVRAWRVLGNGDEGGAATKEGGWVHAVATSSDGRWIAGGTRMTITIWNATTYEKVVELKGHTDAVTWFAFSPDSARVASGSRDGTGIVWSATTGEQLVGSLKGHAGWVWSSVAWTPDGQRLMAGCWGGSIKFLDASTGSLLSESNGHTDVVRSIVVPLNGKFTASASWDCTVRFWDTTTCQQIGPSLQHENYVESVAISPDGRHFVVSGTDSDIRVWRVPVDGGTVETVMREEGYVHAVAVSSDGRWIAGGMGNIIKIWNATTHKKVGELGGHCGAAIAWLAFSPDSARLASGSQDRTAIIWSMTTRKPLVAPLQGHTGWVWCVAFSPNGSQIASSDREAIRIWHSHSGALALPQIQVNAVSVAWTPDGQRLIAGCWDGSIKFWDALTGSLLAESNGHTRVVRSIAVPLNGKFFASASWDSTVRLWDMVTRQQIGPALQHNALVESVAISPDGSHLTSGGHDKEVHIWSLQQIVPESLLENISTTNIVRVYLSTTKLC